MPEAAVKFNCDACGQSYRWKPELAGKRVRCKCGQPLQVPAQPPGQASRPRPAEEEVNPFLDMLKGLDSPGTTAGPAASPAVGRREAALTNCPSCGAAASPAAVICVQCGEDLDAIRGGGRGRKLKTKVVRAPRDRREKSARPAKSPGRGKSPGVKIAGAGLAMHGGGWLLMGLSLVLVWLILRAATPGDEGQGNALPLLVWMLGLAGVFIGPLLTFAAPSDAGRQWIVVAAGCLIAGPVIAYAGYLAHDPVIALVTIGTCAVLLMVSMLAVLLFLVQFARYLGHVGIEAHADKLLNVFKLAIMVHIVGVGIAWVPGLAPLVGMIFIFLDLLLIVLYVSVTFRLGLAALSD